MLPKAGLVVSEKGNLTEVLCKPKILPLKSITLQKLEEMEVTTSPETCISRGGDMAIGLQHATLQLLLLTSVLLIAAAAKVLCWHAYHWSAAGPPSRLSIQFVSTVQAQLAATNQQQLQANRPQTASQYKP